MLKNSNLNMYAQNGFPNIHGWVLADLFEIVDFFGSTTPDGGGVLEIGVHHGKFYLMLNQLTNQHDRSFAVDVFDAQHLNIDHSGHGSLEIFMTNLITFDAHKGKNTKIICGDSTDSSLRLRERIGYGSLRFISIDGGHTAEHTINDLNISNDLIKNEGIVILDDFLNGHWLGVAEGIGRFLATKPTLVPFATGFNKLFLCKLSYHGYYYKLMNDFHRRKKVTEFYGNPIVAM